MFVCPVISCLDHRLAISEGKLINRYQSMDFLRAVAILLVIVAHAVLSYGAPTHLAPLQLGGVGVDLFFVLSGWLLGGQLFKEVEVSGRIDVRRFWFRRWMRTLPAYYAVLIVSVTQRYLTKEDVRFPWEYFVFIQNYFHPLEFFSISWSLCVEEQFYLLIAPLVALSVHINKQSTTWLLLLIFLLPCFFRMLGFYESIEETHVRIDGCVAGVLLAHIYRQRPDVWALLARYAPQIGLVGLVVFLYFFAARYFSAVSFGDPGKLALAIVFASWVLIANADSGWRKIIYMPGAYHIATRSYALYLIHPEVLALMRRFALELPFPVYLFMALVGSLLLAEGLYLIVEKPIMDARERYAFSKSK